MRTLFLLMILFAHAAFAADEREVAACMAVAAERFGLDPLVLYAIKHVESSNQLEVATRHNSNGSRDVGLMQINSVWFDELQRRFSINEARLEEPCVNIAVAAWILNQHVQSHGLWVGVGRYHSTTPSLRRAYTDKVKNVWDSLLPNHYVLGRN